MGLLLLLNKPSSGVAPLDIKASVGTSTSPTSTGTKAVTGVGFEPKVVMPFGGPSITQESILGAILGLGAGTSSSSRASICVSSNNGVTTSDTDRRHDNTKVFTTLSSTGSVLEAADLSSLDTDGFTQNWSTVDANARILNHICLGGADLEVSLTQHQFASTYTPQSFAHGLSGEPTGLIFFSSETPTAPPVTETNLKLGIGFWSSSNQYYANVFSSDGQTTTQTRRLLRSGSVMGSTTTYSERLLSVASVDATNVNCTHSINFSSSQFYFYMLAIRGAKCQTGTFDLNNSLTPLTINTTGITPKLFLPIFIQQGSDLINSVQSGLAFAIGASDGISNVSCGITDQVSATTTNTRRYQSSSTLVEYSALGTKTQESTASFNGQSVVLTPTTLLNNDWGQGAYLVIGS